MRRWVKIAIPTLLLAGGAVLCAIRWQAWFGMPAEPQWNGETMQYTFPSFETDSTPESLDILVLGDIHNRLTRSDYDSLAARVPQADIIAQAGDWLHRGQEYYRQLLLREWTNSTLYGLPVIVTPGNHEYIKGLHKQLSPVWEQTFTHPQNGPVNVPGATYYTDLPGVRFISIDTNPLVRTVHLTRTLTWLRHTMRSADGKYIVVMMHHPVLSPAKGRFNSLVYCTFRNALRDADLVISGHDHSYIRHTPFVVINTAGKPKPQNFRFTTEYTDTIPAYGVISLEQPFDTAAHSPLCFRVFNMTNGEIIDSLYVTHD